MKNNKGFSLVELIIVIAIMAILVGVMAPQLIKYIEKTNQASDVQLCDSVKTAITTGYMDPSVAKTGLTLANGDKGIEATCVNTDMKNAVAEILNSSVGNIDSDMNAKRKSKLGKDAANTIKVHVANDGGTIEVYMDALSGTITTQAK